MGRKTATALYGAMLLAAASGASAQPQERVAFDRQGGPLAEALRDVATRTGRNLIAPDIVLEDRQAPPLSGAFTAEEAVSRLLAGTDLRMRLVEGTLVIERVPLSKGEGAGEPGDIVVTGTHVRGAPPTSPVITLGKSEIDQSGVTSVEELMRRLPQNLSAGVASQNHGVGGTGQDITQHGAGINLRGLGQRGTLVLVNGRRVAPSDIGSFVDVSLIPVSAIERVEVLTDGASAIYGSDAVGGVVNFILRDDFQGVEPFIQAGFATRGGGRQLTAGATAGGQWTGGRALLSYEYRNERPVEAGDRSFTVNLPDYWNLTPRERRHGLYGNVRQALGSDLTLDLSGMVSDRKTYRDFVDATQILIGVDAEARFWTGNAALQWRPGSSWLVEASAGTSRARTDQTQTQAGALFNTQNTFNRVHELALKADGSLFELPGGSAKLALGGSVRWEHYESLFATAVNVPTPTKAGRRVAAAFGEVNLPFLSSLNGMPGVRRLTVTAAGRFEHYERVGSTFNPKLGLLWSPVDGLDLRGSYGTSFRAPLLSESFGAYNIFLFPVAILYRDPAQATDGVGAAVIGNNPGVNPETSKSLSLGFEAAPAAVPGLRFGANYYNIRFSDRIASPSPQVDLIGVPGFEPVVTLDPVVASVQALFDGANQLLDFSGPGFSDGDATPADVVAVVDNRVSNTAASRTSGLDFLVNYGFKAGAHDLGLSLNANRVFRFDDKLTSASPWIRTLDTPYHNVDWRARAGLSWRLGPVSAVVFLNHVAPYRDDRSAIDRKVGSWTTVDAGIAYEGSAVVPGMKRVRIALNVQNLFDEAPPFLAPANGSTRGLGFDPVNASGLGRFVSLQLRGTW